MSTTIIARQQPASDPSFLIIERILRDREGVWQQIKTEYRLNSLIWSMVVCSTVALACYGLVLGFSNGLLQALASAVKLPVLFFLTLAICLPTLYLFNLLFGARLSVRQALAIVLAAITVTSTLTLAFAPISLFFLISAPSYNFFKLLNVAILALTGSVGLGFLIGGMASMNKQALLDQAAEPMDQTSDAKDADKPDLMAERPVNMGLLNVWVLLYGFVGTQLAWTLRPFFGNPNAPFQIFRPIESNFYVNVINSLFNLF